MRKIINIRGFSLVEIMVALTIGAFLILGLTQVFDRTNVVYRTNEGMTRLQENARFALSNLFADVRNTGALYCSSYQLQDAISTISNSPPLREPEIMLTPGQVPAWMPIRTNDQPNTEPYPLLGSYFIRGYECDDGNCDPGFQFGLVIPDAGENVGDRVENTDVLTVRYLSGEGVPIDSQDSINRQFILNAPGSPPLNLKSGDVAMISDCEQAEIFAATVTGNTVGYDVGGGNVEVLKSAYNRDIQNPRLFNLHQDLATVTYFVRVIAVGGDTADDDPKSGDKTGALIRQTLDINGVAQNQVIIEGVERFDVKYGLLTTNGEIGYFDADVLQDGAFVGDGGVESIPCRDGNKASEAENAGCLWEIIGRVQVSLLLNTISNVPVDLNEPFDYLDQIDQDPQSTDIFAGGVEPGTKLRREITTTIALSNYNR